MPLEIIVGNHQQAVDIPESWLTSLEQAGNKAIPQALENATDPDCPLAHLEELEVTLVDDKTSDRVHQDFMNIEGATDVITFHHGEIVIGIEVAVRQAKDYNEPLLREIFRYLVHGLLHLAGHEDEQAQQRADMEKIQEQIVERGWQSGLGCLIDCADSKTAE